MESCPFVFLAAINVWKQSIVCSYFCLIWLVSSQSNNTCFSVWIPFPHWHNLLSQGIFYHLQYRFRLWGGGMRYVVLWTIFSGNQQLRRSLCKSSEPPTLGLTHSTWKTWYVKRSAHVQREHVWRPRWSRHNCTRTWWRKTSWGAWMDRVTNISSLSLQWPSFRKKDFW